MNLEQFVVTENKEHLVMIESIKKKKKIKSLLTGANLKEFLMAKAKTT